MKSVYESIAPHLPSRREWLLLIIFRIINGFLVQTHFAPDETWQSVEVAHHFVFGYGELTWEWKEYIRGCSHPLLFASLFKVLQVFRLDSRWMIVWGPRMLQSMAAACGDACTGALASRWFGPRARSWTVLCSVFNWFLFYASVRTLSNSMETVMTVIALMLWPWEHEHSAVPGLSVAALSCLLRPTSAVVWLFVVGYHTLTSRHPLSFAFNTLLPVGTVALIASVVIDRLCLGVWTLVPLNFVLFNVLSGGGSFYGVHSWFWYFVAGFPLLLGSMLPIVVMGVWRTQRRLLMSVVVWSILVYSATDHKEERFLMPLLPIALVYGGYYLSQAWDSRVASDKIKPSLATNRSWLLYGGLVIMGVTNIVLAGYLSLVHQRGGLDAMASLAKKDDVTSIAVWMPCHSTPLYAHLHKDIEVTYLPCPPGIRPTKDELYLSVPWMGLEELYGASCEEEQCTGGSNYPSHVVMYGSWFDSLGGDLFKSLGYRLEERWFHSHFGEHEVVILHRLE